LQEVAPHEFVWDGDMLETVVATLKHKSPYCAGAAAATLSFIGRSPRGLQALLKAGAVSAMVPIIQTALPPLDIKKEPGVFQRCAHEHGLCVWAKVSGGANCVSIAAWHYTLPIVSSCMYVECE
jgi:hypothetical protein